MKLGIPSRNGDRNARKMKFSFPKNYRISRKEKPYPIRRW